MEQKYLEMAKNAASAEELLALAKENGIQLTQKEAEVYFTQLHPEVSELSDDELDNVSGGGCGGSNSEFNCEKWECASCGGTVKVEGTCANCHAVASCVKCKHVVMDPDGSYFCNK